MRVWTFVLSIVLAMTSVPALAEWSFFDASVEGDRWFIDFDTLRKGKAPRAWVLKSYDQTDNLGDMSSKALYEANCAEEKIRILLLVKYYQSLGKGKISSYFNEPSEWNYPLPGSVLERVLKTLCAKGNN